jgi:hypothetical protein
VLTVRVAVAPEDAVTFNEEGEIAQVTDEFVVPQHRFTVPVNPFNDASVIVEVADCPGAGVVMVVGFAGGAYIVICECAPRTQGTSLSPGPIYCLSWLLNGPARRDVGSTRDLQVGTC